MYLEVDHHQEDGNGSQQVGAVGQIVSVESLFQRTHFVTTLDQQLEQGNDSTLKLGPLRPCDGVRAEGLPDDILTDVGGNEQGDTRPQPIPLLEHLIQADDNNSGEEQLQRHTL